MSTINYTWNELEKDVDELVNQVQGSGFVPNKIVGLVRGGLIPGVMMSHKMNVPFEALQWSKRDFASQHFGHYIDHICKRSATLCENFLIVDDILDSGDTIGELQHYAMKMSSMSYWMNRIRFATLWKNIDCSIDTSFSARTISRRVDQRWIIFPWE
jgi:hypoxanthine phosphoribosyltransferase